MGNIFRQVPMYILANFLRFSGVLPIVVERKDCIVQFKINKYWGVYQILYYFVAVCCGSFQAYYEIRFRVLPDNIRVQKIGAFAYITATSAIHIPLIIYKWRICELLNTAVRLFWSEPTTPFWKNYFILISSCGASLAIIFTALTLNIDWNNVVDIVIDGWYLFGVFSYNALSVLFCSIIFMVFSKFCSNNMKFKSYQHGCDQGQDFNDILEYIEVHDQLCFLCERLNNFCGVPNISMATICIADILFNVEGLIAGGTIHYFQLVWVFHVISRQLTISTIVTFAVGEAKRSITLASSCTSNEVCTMEEVEIFTLKQLHMPCQFRACGFVNMDVNLMSSIIGCAVTYGVILYQFK